MALERVPSDGMTEIRPYHPDDLEACRSLWVELTQRHREIYGAPTIGGDDPGRQFDEHLAAVGPGNVWVADRAGSVVGLTGLIVTGSEGELEPAIVTGELRGDGIGRLLVDRVVSEARRRGVSLLSVRPVARNSDAVRFFRDAGFDILGHIEAFMDLTEDREWVDGETIAEREFRV